MGNKLRSADWEERGYHFDPVTRSVTVDKSLWDRGAWDNEPDRVEWQDPATGLTCLAVRNLVGAWCGYVGVGANHKLHGITYDGCVRRHKPVDAKKRLARMRANRERAKSASERRMAVLGIQMELQHPMPRWNCTGYRGKCKSPGDLLEAHGGITYSRACQGDGPICHTPAPGTEDHLWWFGFDCAHSGDVAPAMTAMKRMIPDWPDSPALRDYETYRDLAYCQAQTRELAMQLAVL